jgi:translocation and assembly module TamB
LKRLLLFLIVILLSLGVTLTWVMKTEQGFQFLIQQASDWLASHSNQTLKVDKTTGTVWDGISIDTLDWQNGYWSLQLQQLELQLQWAKLLQGELVITNLSAKSVHLGIPPHKEDQPPPVLPESIRIPVHIDLQQLLIEKLKVNGQTFNSLRGQLQVQDGQLDIQQFELNTQDTQFNSRLNIVLQKPYQLEGDLIAQRSFEELLLNAKLKLDGTLERLELNLDALGQNPTRKQLTQQLKADAVLTPFSHVILEKLNLLASDFNPSHWFNGAPNALLTVSAHAKPNQDFSHSTGQVNLKNTRPMAIQLGGIPVSQLNAQFEFTLQKQIPKQLDLNIENLVFANQKRIAGRANMQLQWQAATLPTGLLDRKLMAGNIKFMLNARQVDASLFTTLPKPIALNAHIEGIKNGSQIRLNHFTVRDGESTLNGTLTANLNGEKPLELALKLQSVNPGNYIDPPNPWLQGNLNGDLQFKGQLKDPSGTLNLNLDQSTLARAPLKLKAQASGSLTQLNSLNLDLDLVGNTVRASGGYGTDTDFIDLDVNFDELGRLGRLVNRKLAGKAHVKGKLRSIQGNFSSEGNFQIRQLKWEESVQIETAQGQLKLGAAPTAPWSGDIELNQVKVFGASSNVIEKLTLTLRGIRNQHRLQGNFSSGLQTFSRNRPIKGEFAFTGGLLEIQKPKKLIGWKGAMTQFKIEGLWSPARSFSLQSPAPFTLASGQLELLDWIVKGEDNSLIHNKLLRVDDWEIKIQGDMPQFFFPRMSPILRKQLTVEPKDLIAKVQWNYVANPNHLEGHIDVSHLSGGLQVLEDSQIEVDIRTLTANLDFNRHATQLNLDIQADEFGTVNANLRLPVVQNPQTKTWGIAWNQAIEGSLAAGFTELNWLGPLISGGIRTSGTGQVAMAIGGTASKPEVQGRLFGMGLNVFQLDQGIRLEDGQVVVDFTNDQASIDTFEFTVYNRLAPRRYLEQLGPLIQGTGQINATGIWNLTGLDGEIQLHLDQVPLLQRSDRWMMVNSHIQIRQPKVIGQALTIRGELNTLGAYFEKPKSGPESLGDDVFIQGRSQVSHPGLPIDLQIQANLGDRFYMNAEGLRTRLEGGLRLVMLEGVGGSGQRRSGRRLTARGTIQTADGSYRAYGQDLSIDRGVVNFQGPLDNPGLNLRAVRKGVAVEAGVEVTGTAQRPIVSLVSEPAVPDSEKLSWMILGRGSGSADRDATLLLTAASAIFGDSDESTTRKIAKSLGIDDLSLSTGSLTAADSRAVGSRVAIAPGADISANGLGASDPLLSQRIVSIGKHLSDNIYLGFDQSVSTAASILKLNYQYSRQLSFIARTGADNAIDLLYQMSFD